MRVMKNNKQRKAAFIKATISIPTSLTPHVSWRKKEPQHAGNFSSYVRSLIIADKKGVAA